MSLIQSSNPDSVLILGIGNPLMGDDGVGNRVIEMLATTPLPSNVSIKDAGLPGWGLPNWFENESTVIMIDAIQMDAAPGTWRRFYPEEVRFFMESETLSLHQPALANGLALAEALHLLPQNLILYGIQPAYLTPGAGLSSEVEKSLPHVVTSLLNEIEKKA